MIKSEVFLGCDLDGVIIDHTASKILLARKFDLNIIKSQTHGEKLSQLLGSRYAEFKHDLYDNPKIALASPMMPGAKKVLQLFCKAGVRFAAISRRSKNFSISITTLHRYGLWPDIFNEQNTFFVQNKEGKNIKAAELGISHFIDDEPEVLEQLTSVKIKYLFDPHDILVGQEYIHIRSWPELVNHIL